MSKKEKKEEKIANVSSSQIPPIVLLYINTEGKQLYPQQIRCSKCLVIVIPCLHSHIHRFGEGNETSPIFLNGVRCSNGYLSHLMRCRPNAEALTNCTHETDVAVFCGT